MPRGISTFATTVLAAGLLGFAVAPAAAQEKGFYIGGTAGVSLPDDSKVEVGASSADVELKTGFAGGLQIGHAYGNGFRTELELGLHANDTAGATGFPVNGDIRAFSLMLNALYDFKVDWPVRPFIGAGLGAARVSLDANGAPGVAGTIDDNDISIAWQGMAGLAYDISDQLEASVRYRYFSAPNLSYTSSGATNLDADYASHDIMAGLRWKFGAPKMAPKPMPVAAPAPPPPPPPPPPPKAAPPPITRNFIVFFDFDSAALTAQARSIIQAAAAESRKRSGIRIALTGHTDRAGRASYNQRLSMRRAVAVRDELVKLGIASSDIGVTAKGESAPLVTTADGVREPQNRRVEIVLQ